MASLLYLCMLLGITAMLLAPCEAFNIINKCLSARHVALTFDGGPSASTSLILAALRQHNVTATFYLVPRDFNGTYEGSVARDIYEQGHAVGYGIEQAWDLTDVTMDGFLGALNYRIQTIKTAIGHTPRLVRPPLVVRPDILDELQAAGFVLMVPNVLPAGVQDKTTLASVRAALNNASAHDSFIVMQDEESAEDAKNTGQLIEMIREMKFEIVSMQTCTGLDDAYFAPAVDLSKILPPAIRDPGFNLLNRPRSDGAGDEGKLFKGQIKNLAAASACRGISHVLLAAFIVLLNML